MRYRLAIVGVIAGAFGCNRSSELLSPLVCAPPLAAVDFTTDSTAALCLLPGFTKRGDSGGLWARGAVADADYAWVRVAVLDPATGTELWGTRPSPPSFRRPDPPDVIHALRVDSVVVHRETIEDRLVEIETALVSGGFDGARRQPALQAIWWTQRAWVVVQARAASPTTIDSLRAMARTVHVTRSGRGL